MGYVTLTTPIWGTVVYHKATLDNGVFVQNLKIIASAVPEI